MITIEDCIGNPVWFGDENGKICQGILVKRFMTDEIIPEKVEVAFGESKRILYLIDVAIELREDQIPERWSKILSGASGEMAVIGVELLKDGTSLFSKTSLGQLKETNKEISVNRIVLVDEPKDTIKRTTHQRGRTSRFECGDVRIEMEVEDEA